MPAHEPVCQNTEETQHNHYKCIYKSEIVFRVIYSVESTQFV